jgi:hypothetical protein
MVFALGAAGSALDALQSLSLLKSSSRTKAADPSQGAASPFDLGSSKQAQASTGMSGHSLGRASISPQTMSALIDAQAQIHSTSSAPANRSDSLKALVSHIDADGSGAMDKTEFEDALGAGGTNLKAADDVFGKLDTNGDGSVSIKELAAALLRPDGQDGRHHHTDTVSSRLTADAATDTPTSDGNSDASDADPSDPSDPNSSTNPLRHLPLTLVPNPQISLVPIDPTGLVNSASIDARLNQAFFSPSLSISV